MKISPNTPHAATMVCLAASRVSAPMDRFTKRTFTTSFAIRNPNKPSIFQASLLPFKIRHGSNARPSITRLTLTERLIRNAISPRTNDKRVKCDFDIHFVREASYILMPRHNSNSTEFRSNTSRSFAQKSSSSSSLFDNISKEGTTIQ